MAKALIKAFAAIPDMNFSTSKKEMQMERRDLALDILEASGKGKLNIIKNKIDRDMVKYMLLFCFVFSL